jgi:hypothetical protein
MNKEEARPGCFSRVGETSAREEVYSLPRVQNAAKEEKIQGKGIDIKRP